MLTFRALEAWKSKEQRKRNFMLTTVFVAVMSIIFSAMYFRTNAGPFEGKDLKIAVISKVGGNGWTFEYLMGAKQEGESMGVTVNTFTANHDQNHFHDLLVEARDKNYDGIIVMGGCGKERIDDIQKLVDKGIPILTFGDEPELSNIKGITRTFQDDVQIMQLLLDHMNEKLKGKGNIIYLSTDGYPELIERNKTFKKFVQAHSGIKEIERFGVGSSNVSMQTKRAVAQMLERHSKGQIDAIVATWTSFARGAAQALKEAGRNEIKIYSNGITGPDIQIMQEKNSPWVSTTGMNPREIGAINVRLLLKKIARKETPAEHVFKPVLITQEQLRSAKEKIDMNNLDKVVAGWGNSRDFEEDWMRELKRKHKKEIQ